MNLLIHRVSAIARSRSGHLDVSKTKWEPEGPIPLNLTRTLFFLDWKKVVHMSSSHEPKGKKKAEVRFRGRVQGVLFRANTKKFARSNDLTGLVMNCPDGTVKAIFEGKEEDIKRTIYQCIHEQPYARVSGHDVKLVEYSGKYGDFKVKYYGGC